MRSVSRVRVLQDEHQILSEVVRLEDCVCQVVEDTSGTGKNARCLSLVTMVNDFCDAEGAQHRKNANAAALAERRFLLDQKREGTGATKWKKAI